MRLRRKTYADTSDQQILRSIPSAALLKWGAYVTEVFDGLVRDASFARGVVLNVGAGRSIVPDEVPFLRQFERVVLLEPDDQRRAALTQDPQAAGAEFLSDPIQELDPASVPPADFVLCKWVLQHLPTEEVALAVEQLKTVCAPGGCVGIFSASSPAAPYFVLAAQPDVLAELPPHLHPEQGNRVSREQYDALIADDFGLEYIATHHLSRAWLAERFAGWDVHTQVSSFGALYLQAQRPFEG